MQIKHYLMLARKWIWLVALGLILGLVGGYVLSIVTKPVYVATTKILVSRNRQATNADFAYLSDQQLVQTYIELLKTRPIYDTVEQQLGYEFVSKDITVTQVLTTQVIQVAVKNNDPQRATDIANTLVDVLIQTSEDLQSARYKDMEASLNLQIEQVQAQMNSLNDEYSRSSKVDVKNRIAEINLQIEKFQQEITTLQADITRLDKPGITEDQRVELNEKRLLLAQLEPQLSFYRQIRSNLELLGRPVTSASEAVSQDPGLVQLQSTLKLYEQLYLSLLNNLESIRLLSLQNTTNIAPIESAILPEKPTGFTPIILIVMVAIVGAVLFGGLAAALEFMNDSIKSPGDVDYALGLPTLSCIPDIKTSPGSLYFLERPDSSAADAIRILRKNIIHAITEKQVKTLLVVSPTEGEGKTNLVVNLAASFVNLGHRVAVVDANLRSPRLHKLLKIENTVGLGDILTKDTDAANVITRLEVNQNVMAVTAGSASAELTEQLESDRLSAALAKIKDKADIIFLDGPALFSSDTLAFASRTDAVLLVLRPGYTKIDAARDAVDYLKRVGVQVLGVALNRIPRNWEKYYLGFHLWSDEKRKHRKA